MPSSLFVLLSMERCGRGYSLLLLAGSAGLLLLLGLGDESSDAEVLDEGLEGLVLVDFDVLDLDLGSVGDEVHLSFSLLLCRKRVVSNATNGRL